MLRLVLHIKKRASSNLNADRSKFLANKIARLVLGLYVIINIIQINSRPKQNWKIAYCSLKNMSLQRIGARGDTECQSLKSFLKRDEYIKKKKLLLNLSTIFFSELEGSLAKPFSKRLSVS